MMDNIVERYTLNGRQKVYNFIKRCVDSLAALLGLLVLSPVFVIICLAIKKEEGLKAPVHFSQDRIGVNMKHFKLYKFRTMRTDTPHDVPTHLLENPEQYVTRVGRFLRKTSLDEIPQFINIVKGDMAIAGPRPALYNQDDLIELREAYGVHQLRPGLTGWAQINGRDELEIPEKARLDAYYLKHFGFIMDMRCYFKSIGAVIRGDGNRG